MAWRPLTLAAALLLAASTACSDGSSDAPGERSSSDRRGADGGGNRSGGGEGEPTLADLLGVSGSPEDIGHRLREAENVRQEALRDCMAEQGFEYVPHTGDVGSVSEGSGLPTDLPTDEFRRRYGYGVATGFEASLNLEPTPAPEDPNQAIVAAMSDAERAAYERALHGDAGTDGAPRGCEAEAEEAAGAVPAVMEEFGDELADLYARVEADTRVVEARSAWADCMEEAGYPFSDERAIEEELVGRMNTLYDAVAGEDVPEGSAVRVPGGRLSAEQRAALDEVIAYELDVAEADLGCRGDLDEVTTEVRDEYEARFVDENRARLRELFPDAGL